MSWQDWGHTYFVFVLPRLLNQSLANGVVPMLSFRFTKCPEGGVIEGCNQSCICFACWKTEKKRKCCIISNFLCITYQDFWNKTSQQKITTSMYSGMNSWGVMSSSNKFTYILNLRVFLHKIHDSDNSTPVFRIQVRERTDLVWSLATHIAFTF